MYINQTSQQTPLTSQPARSFHVNLAAKHRKSITANFRAKIGTNNIHYLELELFKQKLNGYQDGSILQSYKASYEQVRWYRTIFFILGCLFLCLSGVIFHNHLFFFSVLLGNISTITKGVLAGFTLLCALMALMMGYSLCIAKEASGNLADKARRKLTRSYAKRRIKQGFHGFAFLKKNCGMHSVLKHQYLESIDYIAEQHEITLHLLQKIQKFNAVDTNYRELLFNQALAEMNDSLQNILKTFDQTVSAELAKK